MNNTMNDLVIFPTSARLSVFCFLITALFCLSFFSLTEKAFAEEFVDKSTKQLEKVQKGIQKSKIRIRSMQEGLKEQLENLKQTEANERALLTEIQLIDKKLQIQVDKLFDLERQMDAQKQRIEEKEKELKKVKSLKFSTNKHLQNRISAYYKTGRIGLINVAFSTKTLPELLSFHDSFQHLINYDKNLADEYHTIIEDLKGVRTALVLEQEVLEDFLLQAKEEKRQTNNLKNEYLGLLNEIISEKNLIQKAIKELESASSRMTSNLVDLEGKKQYLQQGFLVNKGTIPVPIEGSIITKFGQETTNRLGIRKTSSGIAIHAPNGKRVRSIFNGQVIFAGYHIGYGNTVIIHHGYNYFSIISRIEKIVVVKGEELKTGDIIGLTGETATLIEDGLYLEIRHKKTPLDPLEWIDKTKLKQPELKTTQSTSVSPASATLSDTASPQEIAEPFLEEDLND